MNPAASLHQHNEQPRPCKVRRLLAMPFVKLHVSNAAQPSDGAFGDVTHPLGEVRNV